MAAANKEVREEYARGMALETGNGGTAPTDAAAAVQVYRTLIECSEYPKAKAALGRLYDRGYGGLERNEAEALRLFEEAEDARDGFGVAMLGNYHMWGRGGLKRDGKKALALFRQSAEAGDPEGAVGLGEALREGRGGLPIDDVTALKYFRFAADKGWARGTYALGYFFQKGRGGLVRNEKEALRLYRIAAAQDDPGALGALGVFHLSGMASLALDAPQGCAHYRRAAKAGDAIAMALLAQLQMNRGFARACNIEYNVQEGLQWASRSAAEGSPVGQSILADCYRYGDRGVEQDEARALRLTREAASMNYTSAMRDLGDFYRLGVCGLDVDHEEAVRWYTKGADMGSEACMGWLASYYARGTGGVKQDKIEARLAALLADATRASLVNRRFVPRFATKADTTFESIESPCCALRLVRIAIRAQPHMLEYSRLERELLEEDPTLEQQLAKRLDVAALFASAVQAGSPVQPWMRGKLMLVGQGRVGKSCTLRSLLCQEFDAYMKSTRGADTKTCTVERVDVQKWREQAGHAEARGFDDALAYFVAQSIDQEEGNKRDDASEEHQTGEKNKRQKKQKSDQDDPTLEDSKQTQQNAKMVRSAAGITTPVVNDAERERIAAHNERLKQEAEEMVQRFNKEGNVDMIMKIRQQNNTQELSFSVWDYGGQRVFYALHHLFLTRYGVYLVCFNMEELVADDEREGALRFLSFWLNSIRMHAEGAPVLLVGTHKDKVPNATQHAQIAGVIRARLGFGENDALEGLRLHPYAEAGLPFFPVDNTTSGTEHEDPVLGEMRAAVQNAVKDDPLGYINLKFPISWRNVLDEMLGSGEAFISLDDVHEIAERCFAAASDVPNMLKLFHELGALVYFGENPALVDVVTLKPQWLVDAISLIIRDYDEHENNFKQSNAARDMRDSWATLKNKAVISKELLHLLWRGYDEAYLTELMLKSQLLCPWPSFDQSPQAALRSYLVPCLLHNTADSEHRSDEAGSAECYLLDFSPFFLPDGLFERLVCALLVKETAESDDAQRLRGATVTANVAKLAARCGKFRLEGERRVTAMQTGDGHAVKTAANLVPRDCIRVVVEHSSDGGAAVVDLLFGVLEEMNAATFGGSSGEGAAAGGLKWCVRTADSELRCTMRSELPRCVREWRRARGSGHRAQRSDSAASQASTLEEIESGPVEDFIRCSRAIVGLVDCALMEHQFLGTGLFVSFKGHLCVLTSAHVLASPKHALSCAATFEYGASSSEEFSVKLTPGDIWAMSPAPADMTSDSAGTMTAVTLDYVLCALDLSADEDVARRLIDRQPIVLATDSSDHAVDPDAQSRIVVFGHPAGLRQYKSEGRVVAQSPFEITYSGKTFSGSSGSPVFVETSKAYRLVGLHRSGDLELCEGKGLRIDMLVEDLSKNHLIEEATHDHLGSLAEVDALDDIDIEFAGAKRVEQLTSVELADSVRPLLPRGGKAYGTYLHNMEKNDEIDGKEVVRSVKDDELDEIMEELCVTTKRHSRRLQEAFLQLIMSDEDYRPLYDFLKLYRLDGLFMRFLQAGVYTDLGLLFIYRSGQEQFASFLTEPPMHLNDVDRAQVTGAALALVNSGKYESYPEANDLDKEQERRRSSSRRKLDQVVQKLEDIESSMNSPQTKRPPAKIPRGKTYAAFLSHSKKQAYTPQTVILTKEVLRERHLPCFMDIDDLRGAKKITKEQLEVEIKQSCVFVLFLDDKTLDSEWCRHEIGFAAKSDVPIHVVVDTNHNDIPSLISHWERKGGECEAAIQLVKGSGSHQFIGYGQDAALRDKMFEELETRIRAGMEELDTPPPLHAVVGTSSPHLCGTGAKVARERRPDASSLRPVETTAA